MIQISTTAPASWPGASTPLIGPTRPVAAVTPVAPVGSVGSLRPDDNPARTRAPGSADTQGAPDAGSSPRAVAPGQARQAAVTEADQQALAEQRRADEEAREAREAADRQAIERLRQVLVDTWDASAAVVEQALSEKDPGGAAASNRRVSLYDEATLAGAPSQAGQIISQRV